MKRFMKFNTLVVMMVILSALNITKINASPQISMNAPASVNVGSSFSVTFFNGSNEHTYSAVITASGAASGSQGVSLAAGQSQTVFFTANTEGSINLSTRDGIQVAIAPPFDVEPLNFSRTVTSVMAPVPGGGGTSSGGGGGTSSGGETSTGGGGTTETPAVSEETAEERLEREKREKEEQRERDLKIPLIESISITSEDESRNGKLLTTINSKEETFEYSYSLPIFVNKIGLDVKGTSDDVTFEFEKSHEVLETKEIKIKASNGDIAQEFTLTLNAQSLEDLKVEDGFVYNDDELTKAFKDLGFELTEYELDGKKLSMFNKKDLNLQMIVNDNREALFYRLDEKGNVLDKGQLVVHEKEVLFVLAEAGEELQDKKLYGNGYSSIDLPKPTFLDDVDDTLKVKQLAAGWEFEEGVIVLALDDTLDKDMYHIVSDKPFKAAVVAFDGQSSPVMVYALIASLVALLSVTVGFITYYLKSKKRIQILLSRN